MQLTANELELFLESLLEYNNEAVCIINKDGHVLYWSHAAEKTYHIPKEDIIGQHIQRFFRKEDLVVLQMLETKKPVKGVYHRPRPDKHVLIHSTPVYNRQSELIGTLSVEQDISQIVKLNEELSDASFELDELKHEVSLSNPENPFSRLIGKSSVIQESIHLATKVAKTDATVLLTGESGVGKELFARSIHDTSHRKDRPFIAVNCGAIPQALFESELFGYEAGAFTGAIKEGKHGKIEAAQGGTLFLDEIGEMPQEMQIKLLRVLQEKEIYRVGGNAPIPIDVRILSATNRNLKEHIAAGHFREDLFYRLHVVSIEIPPLRERIEDIPELVHLFLYEFAHKYEKPVPLFSPEVMHLFLRHPWKGNIRELRNTVERIVILNDRQQIDLDDIKSILPLQPDTKETNPFSLPPHMAGEYGTPLTHDVTRNNMTRTNPVLHSPEENGEAVNASNYETGESRADLMGGLAGYTDPAVNSHLPRSANTALNNNSTETASTAESLQTEEREHDQPAPINAEDLKEEQRQLEEMRIRQALTKTYGNKSAAAKLLGISRATLYKKMKAYRIGG